MTKEEIVEKVVEKKEDGAINFGALTLIAFGIILLLNNFGTIPWSFWDVLIRFWPVIFVLIGIDIISGKTTLGRTLSSLINTAIVLFIVIYSLSMVSNSFNSWLNTNFPGWKEFRKDIPFSQNSKQKIFDCNTRTNECRILYK